MPLVTSCPRLLTLRLEDAAQHPDKGGRACTWLKPPRLDPQFFQVGSEAGEQVSPQGLAFSPQGSCGHQVSQEFLFAFGQQPAQEEVGEMKVILVLEGSSPCRPRPSDTGRRKGGKQADVATASPEESTLEELPEAPVPTLSSTTRKRAAKKAWRVRWKNSHRTAVPLRGPAPHGPKEAQRCRSPSRTSDACTSSWLKTKRLFSMPL